MKRYIVYLSIITIITLSIVFFTSKQHIQTIKFFPIDPTITFDYAETKITLEKDDQPFEIAWKSESKSDQSLYLRQDVSLLYNNGKLQGLKSNWMEDEKIIDFQENIQGNQNSFLQAISFHHGESHANTNEIKSVQQMSYDQLYIIKQHDSTFSSFKQMDENVKDLDKQTRADLLAHWNKLIHHYNINIKNYQIVPLTSLQKVYEKSTIPLPENDDEQIVGQLWEGLYKNYILPTTEEKSDSYVPVILFAKDETHLYVLFEIDGQCEQLVQKYPNGSK